jgi:hypothetical protein
VPGEGTSPGLLAARIARRPVEGRYQLDGTLDLTWEDSTAGRHRRLGIES